MRINTTPIKQQRNDIDLTADCSQNEYERRFKKRLIMWAIIYYVLLIICFVLLPENVSYSSTLICCIFIIFCTAGFCLAPFATFNKSKKEEDVCLNAEIPTDSTDMEIPKNADADIAAKRIAAGKQCELTNREQEVFEALLNGKNAGIIKDEMGISHYTVKAHIGSIYRKANVHSQQELMDWFERSETYAR